MSRQYARIDRLSTIITHEVDVLRLDLQHPVTGGNKYFKLFNNIQAALQKRAAIVTYGGVHSNHIAATAVSCAAAGLADFGIIRSHNPMQTPTLELARSYGMKLIFAGRNDFSKEEALTTLRERTGEIHIIPSGGANQEGMIGCGDILPRQHGYDYVLLACGTGTTMAGMLAADTGDAIYVGISPLKGSNTLPGEVTSLAAAAGKAVAVMGDEHLLNGHISSHCILSVFAGSGFGRYDEEMLLYRQRFMNKTGIALDYIYLPKLFSAVDVLCAEGKIPHGARVLVVHSGGLQGNAAFESRYRKRIALIAD